MSKKKNDKIEGFTYEELCNLTEELKIENSISICEMCGIDHVDCPTGCEQYQHRNSILRVGSFLPLD